MPSNDKTTLSKSSLAEFLIKSQPGLFLLFDKKGNIHWWNNRLEYYSGYTYEEIKNLKVLDLVEEQDKNALQKKIDEAFSTGKADIEIRLTSKKGENILFLLTWIATELEGEQYIMGTGIDITMKEKERSEKMRYFQVLENSKNEIAIFDAETFDLVYVNEGARQNLGYSHDALMKMKAYDIQPEFNDESFRDHIRPLLNGEKDKLKYETLYLRKDGSIYNVEEHLQLIESAGELLLVAIVIDITERLEREKQIKSSLREKELLLGEVHHRVKNNLAIVSSLLNLQAGNAQEDSLKMQFKESESRIKTMAMIHQMLYEQENFSEINFGLYLKHLIKYIEKNFKVFENISIKVHAEEISFDITTAVPCALIVNELVTNAYKHA
ncbi:MAG: PAS domain S-box protein, partial [Balneolales bacterium]